MVPKRLIWTGAAVAVAAAVVWTVARAQNAALPSIPGLNAKAVTASADVGDWKGLDVRVYLRMGFDPRSGRSSWSSGTTGAGLRHVEEVPISAAGVLSAVDKNAVVVTGPNGHVWIPRDQILAVEVLQNPPTR